MFPTFRTTAGAALLLALGASVSAAPVTVPIELEGTINGINTNTRVMTVMGIRVTVPAGTPISSPTRGDLLLLDLMNGPALPERTRNGFLGGTAIVLGEATVDDVTGAIDSVVAADVFAEPSENVLLGPVTAANCADPACTGGLEVLGASLSALTDPRIAAGPPTFGGFELDLSGTSTPDLAGVLAAVEGYFGQTGPLAGRSFHYFLVDLEAPDFLANPDVAEITIERAQCRQRTTAIELSVRGSVHRANLADTTTTQVRIRKVAPANRTGEDGRVRYGDVNVIADPLTGIGRYDFDLRDNNRRICPQSIRAVYRGQGVFTEAPVDVRDDTAP